jgi:signal transduction histidine kinase
LERNDRERREMLAIVAHELRTPLSVLRGRLEGIVDGIYPADGAHIAQALEETYLLGRLVDDLRLLTLAESRQLHFDLSEIDLAGLAARSVELFAAEAEENGIRLNLTIGEGIFPLKADPQRMEQAIGNLVGNALRYVPAGGVVDLTVRGEAGQQMILAVSDSGPGVPEADLPHIFDRFWRADSARSRHTGGSGLGLAIAKELIEAQGGQIRARNRVEGGLEVMISFSKS